MSEEASLCEGCPLRNRMTGPVAEIATANLVRKRGRFYGLFGPVHIFDTQYGVLLDTHKNPSEVIRVPANWSLSQAQQAVSECEYPDYQTEGLIFKKDVAICRALGNLTTPDDEIRQYVMQQFV